MPVNIESTLANAATGGIGSLIGQGVSAIGNAIFGKSQAERDAEQLQQQGALQQQQIAGSEQLTDYGRQSQLKYQEDQYGAQIRGLTENGLNPALIYGGAGAGGATGGSVVQVQGGQAADTAQSQQADTAQQAQQTNSATAQQQMEQAKAQTELITAQTANTDIASEGLELQNKYDKVRNEVQEATTEQQIGQAEENLRVTQDNARNLEQQLVGLSIDNTTKMNTQKAMIETANQNLQLLIQQKILIKAQTTKTKIDAQAIQQQVEQGFQRLKLEARGQEVSIQNANTMAHAIMISAGIGAASSLIKTGVEAAQ